MDLKLSRQRRAVLAATAIVAIDASDQPSYRNSSRSSMSAHGHGPPCDLGSGGLPAAASYDPNDYENEPYWQGTYRSVDGQHSHAGQVQPVPGPSSPPHAVLPAHAPPGLPLSCGASSLSSSILDGYPFTSDRERSRSRALSALLRRGGR